MWKSQEHFTSDKLYYLQLQDLILKKNAFFQATGITVFVLLWSKFPDNELSNRWFYWGLCDIAIPEGTGLGAPVCRICLLRRHWANGHLDQQQQTTNITVANMIIGTKIPTKIHTLKERHWKKWVPKAVLSKRFRFVLECSTNSLHEALEPSYRKHSTYDLRSPNFTSALTLTTKF